MMGHRGSSSNQTKSNVSPLESRAPALIRLQANHRYAFSVKAAFLLGFALVMTLQ